MRFIDGKSAVNILPAEAQDKYPFPFLSPYGTFISETEGGNVIWVQDNNIVMPVLRRSKAGFTMWQCLFPPVCGGRRLSKEGETKFLDDLVNKLSKEHHVERIIQSPTFALFKAAPSRSTWAPFGTYIIDLENQSIDDIWMGMKSNYRQVIRKAERDGVTVLTGIEQTETFYFLYKATTQRSCIHTNHFSHFQSLTNNLTSEHVYCSTAWVDGQPEGGIFILYSRYGAYVLYAGSADNVRHPGSMKLVHWIAIQYMAKRGVRCYDFVGARLSDVSDSPLGGIQRFKSGFGTELKKGVLWKCEIDPVRCKLADTVQYLRHGPNSRQEDIIDQELQNGKPDFVKPQPAR